MKDTSEQWGEILIVDDDLASCRFMEITLTEVGLTPTRRVHSGKEALSVLLPASGQHAPSKVRLVLTDLHLPGMDGLELCRHMKASPELQDIPVIVVTGDADEQGIVDAFNAGADDYISKPITAAEISARVGAALRLHEEMALRKVREQELVNLTRRLQAMSTRLEHLSLTDSLTGIGNRRSFDATLEREWKRAVRRGAPLSLVMIDIDHFKAFNDSLGHQAGDECLRRVAVACGSCLNRPADGLYRYGGEELAAVLPETDGEGAHKVALEMVSAVHALTIPHPASPVEPVVTVSSGVANAIPQRLVQPFRLIQAADEALYAAKESGRNRVVVDGSWNSTYIRDFAQVAVPPVRLKAALTAR